jgi:hypothetical protein
VSPFTSDEVDRASSRLRALWPGTVRVARVDGKVAGEGEGATLDVRAETDDPLVIAAELAGARRLRVPARLVRDSVSAADSAWADRGGVVIRWPSSASVTPWAPRIPVDTSGAVVAGGVVVVSSFPRRSRLSGEVVRARWSDGDPAAVERAVGSGCIRDVAIDVPIAGDLVLTPAFGRLLRVLSGPCAGALPAALLPDSALTWLTSRSSGAPRIPLASSGSSRLASWLFGLALVLGLIELLIRRRRKGTSPVASESHESEQSSRSGDAPQRIRVAGGAR